MVDYEGLFFDDEEIKTIQKHELNYLGNIHECVHITFIYKPDNDHIYDELLSKEIDVYLIAYGSDKNNSGFLVEIPEEYMKYYDNRDEKGNLVKPHLTASISDNGKAKETSHLNFVPLKEKVKVTGIFGYCIEDENGEEHISFEPQKKTI